MGGTVLCRTAETRAGDLVVVLIDLAREGSFFGSATPSLPDFSFRRDPSDFLSRCRSRLGRLFGSRNLHR